MKLRSRRLLPCVLVALCFLPTAAVAQQPDPADQFAMSVVGENLVRVQRTGHEPVDMGLVVQSAPSLVVVQVRNPTSGAGGFFRYIESEGRIEFGVGDRVVRMLINPDGTVRIGETVCDGRTNKNCIAQTVANAVADVPVEAMAAMRLSLRDAMAKNPSLQRLGAPILETFRLIVREMVRREDLKQIRVR